MTDLPEKLREAFKRKRYGAGEYDPDFDLFDAAADGIEGLRREILRCDDACYERDKELAQVAREREDYNGMHQLAVMEIDRLRAALLNVRNWLDVQFNEPFKNSELTEHIGLINEVLPVLAISNGERGTP